MALLPWRWGPLASRLGIGAGAAVALPRRLVVDAVVQPAGQVSEASTEVSAEAGSCIVDALRGITFPSFQGADPVSVHFEYVNLRRE